MGTKKTQEQQDHILAVLHEIMDALSALLYRQNRDSVQLKCAVCEKRK